MSDDDSSDLSSVPSDDELERQLNEKGGILRFLSTVPKPDREASPPRPKRDPSPPHEYVLADNPDIAFIVMFRARFTEAFPKSLANFGPQEIERDVVDIVPGEHAEHFLCALLGMLLNRKQDIKPGHYNRALEEAIQSHKSQWAKDWESKNPLSGGTTFSSMSPSQRLTLLRTLILWSLASSDAVRAILTTSYKQNRHEDDLNQPLSVQPWGSDADKRRYYLIEGLDDTHFRVYREGNYTGQKRTWWSVASDIDELKQLAHKLETEDRGQKARLLSSKILAAVPRFEATEEKRKRREYRQARKQQFKRPEPNLSLYEGRTRGKRIKYTYSEDEDDIYSDGTSYRRSTRNTGTHTPAEGLAPTVTLSGRQVRSRQGGAYGESILSGAQTPAVSIGNLDRTSEEPENTENAAGRPRRAATASKPVNGYGKGGAHIEGYNSVDAMDSDEDDASEQDYGDDEEEEDPVSLESDIDDQGDLSEAEDEMLEDVKTKSLVIKLPVKTPTPEKQNNVQAFATPEQESLQLINLPSTANNDSRQGDSATPKPASINSSRDTGNTAQPISSFATTSTAPSLLTESSERASAPTQSSLDPSPPSPLALRGNPEKPHSFTSSINVGYGGA